MLSATGLDAPVCERQAVIERARKQHRSQRKMLKHLQSQSDNATEEKPEHAEELRIYKRNGQWVARSERNMAIDDDPETALRRLLIRMRVGFGSITDIQKRMALYRSISAPSCEIVEFSQKPDLAGDKHYVVDFTTNARLCRGDIEGLFGAMMRQTLSTEATNGDETRGTRGPLDGVSEDAERCSA